MPSYEASLCLGAAYLACGWRTAKLLGGSARSKADGGAVDALIPWVALAFLTLFERWGVERLVQWLPLYSVLKSGFLLAGGVAPRELGLRVVFWTCCVPAIDRLNQVFRGRSLAGALLSAASLGAELLFPMAAVSPSSSPPRSPVKATAASPLPPPSPSALQALGEIFIGGGEGASSRLFDLDCPLVFEDIPDLEPRRPEPPLPKPAPPPVRRRAATAATTSPKWSPQTAPKWSAEKATPAAPIAWSDADLPPSFTSPPPPPLVRKAGMRVAKAATNSSPPSGALRARVDKCVHARGEYTYVVSAAYFPAESRPRRAASAPRNRADRRLREFEVLLAALEPLAAARGGTQAPPLQVRFPARGVRPTRRLAEAQRVGLDRWVEALAQAYPKMSASAQDLVRRFCGFDDDGAVSEGPFSAEAAPTAAAPSNAVADLDRDAFNPMHAAARNKGPVTRRQARQAARS